MKAVGMKGHIWKEFSPLEWEGCSREGEPWDYFNY